MRSKQQTSNPNNQKDIQAPVLSDKQKNTKAKIIFLDIETAPSLGWVWGKWEQNVLDFEENGYLLSFGLKRAGERKVTVKALPDYKEYSLNKKDDSALMLELWKELDWADIVIAHNGDKFDLPTINTRFISLGWRPPTPYQTIDTLKIARNRFEFKSNKLDDLGRDLNLGRKLSHTGMHLWFSCMSGDEKAWRVMKRYNRRDVLLLEDLYYKFLPWINNHPNTSNNTADVCCLRCSSSRLKKANAVKWTNMRRKDRLRCLDCGGWQESSARKN